MIGNRDHGPVQRNQRQILVRDSSCHVQELEKPFWKLWLFGRRAS